MLLMFLHLPIGYFHRFSQSDNSIDIFSSATHIPFLRTAIDHRTDLNVMIDKQKTCTFRAMQFMSSTNHKVYFQLAEIMWIMTEGLNRIAVKNSIILFAYLPYPFDICK